MKVGLTPWLAAASLSLVCNNVPAQTVVAPFPGTPSQPGNTFTRMFPDLPAFAEQNDRVRALMQSLGAPHGLLDAEDKLTDPVQSILNPAVFSPQNRDNPKVTAGVTFFGQFLDHDLTFDKNSQLNKLASPETTTNFRTSLLDLDTIYGNGPEGSPQLYDVGEQSIKFRTQTITGSEHVSKDGTTRDDVPRDDAGKAIIGDSRNDENVVISQMHLALMLFHNAVTDYLSKESPKESATALFVKTRRLVTWHYQWIVLHEYLPAVIGQDRVDQILEEGLRFYKSKGTPKDAGDQTEKELASIPAEFAIAAYRFGHSQVRPSYRLNFGANGGTPFFAFLFNPDADSNIIDPNDLRGGKRAPRRFVDWQTFFDFGDGNVRPNKRIDSKLSTALMRLPGARGSLPGLPSDGVQSLPARTLIRHVDFGLPSGQAVARKMKMAPLSPEQLHDLAHLALDNRNTMATSTPLFYYVLKEAEVMENGLRLGPVGARIVGEVFIGVLTADRASYLSIMPDWQPSLPSMRAGTFTMADLLQFAGVVHPI